MKLSDIQKAPAGLKSDKWADMPETKRLKEFVRREKIDHENPDLDQYAIGVFWEAECIFAEMERLEKERP